MRPFARDAILPGMLSHEKWAGETAFRNWRTNGRIPVLDTHFLIRDPETQHVVGMATITRESTPGATTTFYVALPISAEAREAA